MSEIIEQFLKDIRKLESEYEIAKLEMNEMETATQDILHFLELRELGYFEREQYASMLGDIRRKRREAKDKVMVMLPLVEWAKNNKGVFRNLEQILGKMRKAEKRIQNRTYTPKVLEQCNENN